MDKFRVLVGIPCLFGSGHTKEAIESVIAKENVDVLLIDNGSELAVKDLIHYYSDRHDVFKIHNPENVYVNKAWTQILEYFLEAKAYTHVVIMNSDLIMRNDWSMVLQGRWEVNPDEICIPVMQEGKPLTTAESPVYAESLRVYSGTAGVFITLSRKQAKMVYPLPEECKVWFGDNWIYSIMRALDYPTVIPSNLISYHYWSQNVSRVEGISEIIEEDKRQWTEVVEPMLMKKIEELKNKI